MAVIYEYSKLPEQIYDPPTFKNLSRATDDVIYLVNQIKELQAAGNYTRAAMVVESNYDVLKDYYVDEKTINAISEEIMALEYFATATKQSTYFTDAIPVNVDVQDSIWISTADI